MPKSIKASSPQNIRLKRLNCDVKFSTQVENERHEKTKRILKDEEGKPIDKPPQVRAHLIPRGGDGTPWISALGNDEWTALDNVLDLADKTPRNSENLDAVTKERDELRRQIAEADRRAVLKDQELAAHMSKA